jgi:hypothetical protein
VGRYSLGAVIQGSCRSSKLTPAANAGPASGDTQPTAHEAVDRVAKAILQHKMRIIDIDLRRHIDIVRHDRLLAKVERRIHDP